MSGLPFKCCLRLSNRILSLRAWAFQLEDLFSFVTSTCWTSLQTIWFRTQVSKRAVFTCADVVHGGGTNRAVSGGVLGSLLTLGWGRTSCPPPDNESGGQRGQVARVAEPRCCGHGVWTRPWQTRNLRFSKSVSLVESVRRLIWKSTLGKLNFKNEPFEQ